MPQPDSIKQQLLKRLRRTNMSVARQVRLLDDELLQRMGGASGELNPQNDSNTASIDDTLLQFEQDYARLSVFFNPDSKATGSFQQKTQAAFHQAHTLVQDPPKVNASKDEMTLRHFQRLHTTPTIDSWDTLPTLAHQARLLLSQSDLEQSLIRDYSQRALWCIKQVSEALETFKQDIIDELSLTIYRHEGITLISSPENNAPLLNTSRLRALFDIPKNSPVMLVSDTLKQGRLPILGASPRLGKGWSLDDAPLAVSLDTDTEQSALLFSQGDNTDFIDNLFNNKAIEKKRHPLMQLTQFWAKQQQPTTAPTLAAQADDLTALSTIHQAAGVDASEFAEQQLPIQLTLSPEQRWFIDKGNRRTLVTLNTINTSKPVTIYPEAHSTCGILLTHDTQVRLQQKPVTISLLQNNEKQWRVARYHAHNTQQNVYRLPDPARQSRQQQARQHHQRQQERGYIDKRYSTDELLTIAAEQGERSLDGLTNGLSMTLSSLQADTLISVDIAHTNEYQPNPYYVSMTLYSNTSDGPNVRRVACCIRDPNKTLPTDTQLESLGLTEKEFSEQALTVEAAASHLLKPLNQFKSGRFAVSVINAEQTMRHLKSISPELEQRLKKQPLINRQDLTKRHHLSSRHDRGLTLKLNRNGARPVTFFDTPGVPDGFREQLRQDKGQWFSDDGTAVLQWQDDTVVLYDLVQGLKGDVGTPAALLRQLHSQQKAPNYTQNDGSMLSLRQHHRLANTLNHNADDLPDKESSTPIDIPTLQREQLALTKLREHWPSIAEQIDQSVRFDLSLDDNISQCEKVLSKQGLSLSSPLAGGVGNRSGRAFLLDLREKSPALFAAATAGKGLDLERLLHGSTEQRIRPEQATLTAQDLLYAQLHQAFQNNPAHVAHFSMLRRGVDVLSRMEPTTKEPPSRILQALSKTHGIKSEHLSRLYRAAYRDRVNDSRSFHAFLPTDADAYPMNNHNVGEHLALWSRFSALIPTEQQQAVLHQHALEQSIKQAVNELTLTHNNDQFFVNFNFLADSGKQLLITTGNHQHSSNPEQLIELLEPIFRNLHVRNGLHNLFTRKGNAPDELALDNWTHLVNQFASGDSRALLEKAEEHLKKWGVTAINVRPHNKSLQSFTEHLLLRGYGLTSKPLPFNKSLNLQDLDAVKAEVRKMTQHLPSNKACDISIINELCDVAATQYRCHTSLTASLQKNSRRILPVDDKITRQRRYDEQAEMWSIDTERMSRGDFVLHWLNTDERPSLPQKTLMQIQEAAYNNLERLPTEPLARQIVQQAREALRRPLCPSRAGLLNDVEQEFTVGANNPVDILLDDRGYTSIREVLTQAHTPEAPSEKIKRTRAP